MTSTRTETDSLGEIEVPAEALWGAQTERARRNFPISGRTFSRRFIGALAMIKSEAAVVNAELGVVDASIAEAIREAAEEVIASDLSEHFPVDIFQTGSGTSTNMNVNEVIANRAIQILGGEVGSKDPVHPNDHVNASQSSNDTIPTAIHLAAYSALEEELDPALAALAEALDERAEELDSVVKIGRTHLQDAVPVRLGQEFSGYAQQIHNARSRIAAAKPRLAELALGGTAIGTGLNAPPEFAPRVIARLAERTDYPFQPAPNRFEAMAAKDACVDASGALRTLGVSLTKIANDLRWMGSGPRCGLGELHLPALQPGSSIMPGKVNPVIAEAVLMVAAEVIGNDATIAWAGAAGNFELNVMMPVIADDLLQSIQILASSTRILAESCIAHLEADEERCAELVERSLALVTGLAPTIGYDAAAQIAKEALSSGRTVREVAAKHTELTDEELDEVLNARAQTYGGIHGKE